MAASTEIWKGGETVPVVEDQEDVRGSIRAGLETMATTSWKARNGPEASVLAQEHPAHEIYVLLRQKIASSPVVLLPIMRVDFMLYCT